ncbi:hypothetical protein HDF26_001768 [Pedobacter cryoconitis]|uniref:Uncharacterized protein n=1 Tax=Pedobacter cryoconitis TaxID=188932 RepID=A0A7W9E0T4_9SPHI|nr:hypothetical protein [Pedobacter cryoconitis]MBB5636940.1 hypothetical protein [Pedobacter cryoconitis]MBB6271341.1 hypothetical protein [Pedobacter cryoconitis]
MKLTLTCLFLYLSTIAFAQHIPYPDKPSTHGMMLMGNEVIYASHLPMFHSPHDYQIISILELSKEDQEKYVQDKRKHPKELVYTIEPETFVLPEMINHTKVFKANIYRGHFERGGTKFLENIPVRIKQVIYYKQFDKNAVKPANLQYLLFGNEREQFLVHKITSKPDFDESLIVRVHDKNTLKAIVDNLYITVSFPEKDLGKPFSWKENIGERKHTHEPVPFSAHQTFYLEYGDLE